VGTTATTPGLTREETLTLFVWLEAISTVALRITETHDRYGTSPGASLLPDEASREFLIKLSDSIGQLGYGQCCEVWPSEEYPDLDGDPEFREASTRARVLAAQLLTLLANGEYSDFFTRAAADQFFSVHTGAHLSERGGDA